MGWEGQGLALAASSVVCMFKQGISTREAPGELNLRSWRGVSTPTLIHGVMNGHGNGSPLKCLY